MVGSQGQEAVVGEGDDGLDASARGTVQQERGYDCADAGVEESFAERAGIGNADAGVLHQSRGTEPERIAAGRTESRQEAAFAENTEGVGFEKETLVFVICRIDEG